MKTIEELRESILDVIAIADVDSERREYAKNELDTIIAAARTEGAEQERKRIMREGERYKAWDSIEDSSYITTRYGVGDEYDVEVASEDIFIVPASVLAPDAKEEK